MKQLLNGAHDCELASVVHFQQFTTDLTNRLVCGSKI